MLKKITIKSSPIITLNDSFKSILITVMFPYEEKKEDLAKMEILPGLLRRMCNKYPSEEEFQLEKKKLYILGTGCRQTVIGATGFLTFDFVIPDVYALEKDVLEEQFKFFKEMIYAPKVKDGAFSRDEFTRIVSNINLGMDDALKNNRSYHAIKLRKLIDTDGILSRDLIYNRELLDKETPESMYQYYLGIVSNNQPAIYVMGNVDCRKINELCHKYLYKDDFTEKEFNCNFDNYLVPRQKLLEVTENSKFKDSILSIVYKVKNMSREDVITMYAIRDILSSMSSWLLNRKLRDEASLIYSSNVFVYQRFGVFGISVAINKNNQEIASKKIFEVMEDLKNEELVNEALQNIKLRKKKDLLRQLDDKYFLFDDVVVSDLEIDIPYSLYYERYNKITASEIKTFLDRLVLDTTYFLKEEDE